MEAAYFESLNVLLKQSGIGRPVMLLDLDRLDHNIALVNQQLRSPFHLRIVTKSLPSIALLRYIYQRTNCARLMVFHIPYVPLMLEAFPDADLLLGKPMLPSAAAECIRQINTQPDVIIEAPQAAELSTAIQMKHLDRIQWLLDSTAAINDYEVLARQLDVTLRVCLEIDIGLGRGGASSATELSGMLEQIEASPHLKFSGLMGYDAHLPYLGQPMEKSVAAAFKLYSDFEQAAHSVFPEKQNLTFNSGGSQTWQNFSGAEQIGVNDVSMGSAFLKPGRFESLIDHQAALFIAAPTLKQFPRRYPSQRLPHLDTSSFIYGGGWPSNIVWPEGVDRSARDDAPNENLMPNQSQIYKPHQLSHGVGDFVFFQPFQSDAIFQFEEILILRDNQIVDRWHPIPRRY